MVLLRDKAVGGIGLADELKGAAAEAGHDGVTLAARVACSKTVTHQHTAQNCKSPWLNSTFVGVRIRPSLLLPQGCSARHRLKIEVSMRLGRVLRRTVAIVVAIAVAGIAVAIAVAIVAPCTYIAQTIRAWPMTGLCAVQHLRVPDVCLSRLPSSKMLSTGILL